MAGESTREIKRRITSVKNTEQITKAMEIVAATKLRRAQQKVLAARPFSDKLQEVLGRLLRANAEHGETTIDHPLLQTRPVKRVGYVVITADRGLAGGYNANVIRKAQDVLRADEREKAVVPIGRKGRDFLQRAGEQIETEYVFLGDEIDHPQAREIARVLTGYFSDGVFDEIYLVYNMFYSAMTHRPVSVKLLPLSDLGKTHAAADGADGEQADAGESAGASAPAAAGRENLEYTYEPSATEVLNILLPRYVDTQVFRALLEAKASEHGARMTAMRSATDNAGEMIKELTLTFNRARQAGITKEISEIVGGAEALGG